MRHRLPQLGCVATAFVLTSAIAHGQETLERSPNLPSGWVGTTGILYANLQYRFTTGAGATVFGVPTFDLGMGLPRQWLAGARFAPQSPTVPGRSNEWEAFARYAPLRQARGELLDLAFSAGFNGAAESLDGELSLARWFGSLRLLGAARAMSDAYGAGQARFALAGGAVVHPLEGSLPLALTADVALLLDRGAGEEVAWSAGLQLGVSFTTHTLSLFATNAPTATLQGSSRGDGTLRVGVDFTVPIPVGRFVGWSLPREAAAEAVTGDPDTVTRLVAADMRRYLFAPKQIEILAGSTIEWTNSDDVVHTVNADDGSWLSGSIPPGETWRATFERPGRYPFHCGPHPFMKGVVIVR